VLPARQKNLHFGSVLACHIESEASPHELSFIGRCLSNSGASQLASIFNISLANEYQIDWSKIFDPFYIGFLQNEHHQSLI
jgi:hypothetical protein